MKKTLVILGIMALTLSAFGAATACDKSGQAKADKKASRVAAEGKVVLASSDDGKQAVMVEVNSETDFAAKDSNFGTFASAVAENTLNHGPADVEALMGSDMGGATVEEAIEAALAEIDRRHAARADRQAG